MHASRIEPNTSWKHTKVLTTKPFQHFMNTNENFKVYHVWHESVREIQILTYIFFCKIYSNVTNKKMILKLIQ